LVKLTPVVNFINILHALFCRYLFANKLQSQNVTRKKLRKALSYTKCECKMLMKLTPAGDYCRDLDKTFSLNIFCCRPIVHKCIFRKFEMMITKMERLFSASSDCKSVRANLIPLSANRFLFHFFHLLCKKTSKWNIWE